METKRNVLKYALPVLIVVFLVAAALLGIHLWEKRGESYPVSETEDGTLLFEGKEYVLKSNVESYLVLGLDKYEGQSVSDSHESGVQADFLMLLVFDDTTKECAVLQLDRDTMVQVDKLGVGGVKTDTLTKQLALAYNYVTDDSDKIRCRNTANSVEKLLHGMHIDHYVALTMDAVTTMNDLVGGVEITVLDDFTGIDDTLVKGETVTLKGEQALRYVRSRYGLEDSSNSTRMVRQRQYLHALYDKAVAQIRSDDQLLMRAVDALDAYVVYDSTDYRMKELAEKTSTYTFSEIREIEGEHTLGEEFMEFYPDEKSVWENVLALFYVPKEG